MFRIERDPGPAREQRIKDVGTTTERAGGASGNLQGSLFLGLVILAIWQAAQGNVMAPAVTLLWYAFRTLQAGDTRHL